MKVSIKARRSIEKYILQSGNITKVYFDNLNSISGYYVNENFNRVYFETTYNNDYSKIKVNFNNIMESLKQEVIIILK